MDAIQISRTALDVEWQRLEVIANNIANMNTTRAADGGPFRPARLLSGARTSFARLIKAGPAVRPEGVQVLGVERTTGALRQVYEPTHPHADKAGFVSYPEMDHAGEMALMVKTSRVYEANLTAISIAQQMYSRALGLGK